MHAVFEVWNLVIITQTMEGSRNQHSLTIANQNCKRLPFAESEPTTKTALPKTQSSSSP